MNGYGERLRRFRGNQSPEEAAKALGITVQALNAYEEGRRMPRDEVKKRIRLWMGTDPGKTFRVRS